MLTIQLSHINHTCHFRKQKFPGIEQYSNKTNSLMIIFTQNKRYVHNYEFCPFWAYLFHATSWVIRRCITTWVIRRCLTTWVIRRSLIHTINNNNNNQPATIIWPWSVNMIFFLSYNMWSGDPWFSSLKI